MTDLATSEDLDLHKMYKDECVTPKSQSSARQDRPRCLALTGRVELEGDAFGRAMSAMYGAAFTMKFNN